MRVFQYHCIAVLWGSLSFSWVTYASPPVKVRLRSSWNAPNLLLEVLESAATEQHDAFFPLLDLLTSTELFPEPLASLTGEAIHDASVRILLGNGYLSEPGALDSFELSLALHTASPKVETYHQYYRDHQLANTPLIDGELLEDCTGSWVEWYGRRVCSANTLRRLVEVDTLELKNNTTFVSRNQTKLLSFDHVYPIESSSLHVPLKVAILYGTLTSPNFRPLHEYIYSLSKEDPPRLQYVYRHAPTESGQFSPNYLAGYGVTLDLKKMDYLALDDRKHSRSGTTSPLRDQSRSSDNEGVDRNDDALGIAIDIDDDQIDHTTPLDEEETSTIGIKASQLILSSPKPLEALMHLSQNFPKYATTIARGVTVDLALLEEFQANWQKVPEGYNGFWLNGAVLLNEDVNILSLIRLLRKERELLGQLTGMGLTAPQAIDLLTHEAIVSSQGGNRILDGMFDSSDRREEGGVIVWWNDMEKDSRYATWPTSLMALLRPQYPGQFPSIKQNLFNTVMLVDLSKPKSLAWIIGPVASIIQRGYPFRFGVVPLIETDKGLKAARLFFYMTENFGRSKTIGFLKVLVQSQGSHIDFDLARAEYQILVANADATEEDKEEPKKYLAFEAIIDPPKSQSSTNIDAKLDKALAYAKRLGADLESSSQGHVFINGKYAAITDDFLNTLQTEISQQLQYLQGQIQLGEVTDNIDISTYFYDLPTTAATRNRLIYPTQPESLKVVNLPEIFTRANFLPSSADFVYPVSNDHPPLSIMVIADFDTPSGLKLLIDALRSMKDNGTYRLTFFHNPSSLDVAEQIVPKSHSLSYKLSRIQFTSILNTTSSEELLLIFDPSGRDHTLQESQIPLGGTVSDALKGAENDDSEFLYTRFVRSCRLFTRQLDIAPGDHMLVVNGRLVGPIKEGEFNVDDFENLANYEFSRRTEPVLKAYTNVTGLEPENLGFNFSDDISMLSSVIAAIQIPDPTAEGLFNIPQRPRNRGYRLLNKTHSYFAFGDNNTATYQLGIVLDPLSEHASRWTPLISWLSSLDSVYVEVYLNPIASLTGLPLKQFYRFNLPFRLTFNEDGTEISSSIEFTNLPPDPIYTLGMDVPTAWLVRPHESHHDLDNIHLASFTGFDRIAGVEAIFSLDYLVVEGHARDVLTGAPPRGLQLQLSTSNSTPIADTQVVANLGYLQFKVKPGVFQLEIREGYGRKVFEIESVGNEGWNSPPVTSAGVDITLTSLEGLTLYPRFRRRPGMERADVLAEPQNSKKPFDVVDQVVSSISSYFWPKKARLEIASRQADINIFTVASGLLYERFVSIMILSVLRNTSSTVKFWFIENFLSPSFLEFIPHLAEAYNFQYELVTYKWPSWLRQQKEKQRVIWGYKILFLDVLFPMDLRKVIFVDADQIVRADLKELVDLDLEGAPYGYTPMGDDNTDMEGFRFWKTGYWNDFLRGKPYHISALYVIDLVRFRQLAAGDRLRGSYQQLSADPGSLANLDQDLPNNLQHEVPIFSLPEDWLWCETWCSKDRLHRAKTIDLCQNPLTKEPKLSRARQIPEWEEYDNEISQFARRLTEEGIIRSTAYAAGADSLANVGGIVQPQSTEESGGTPETADEETDTKTRDEL